MVGLRGEDSVVRCLPRTSLVEDVTAQYREVGSECVLVGCQACLTSFEFGELLIPLQIEIFDGVLL